LSPDEKRRCEAAQVRKKLREEMRARFDELRPGPA
jgi:hypothetical protein